jgi:hypothetical protein
MTFQTKNNLVINKEELSKRGYIVLPMDVIKPKKNKVITIRRLISCSECGGDNIVNIKLDAKALRKALDEKSMTQKDFDKLFEALANTPPPKSWKQT